MIGALTRLEQKYRDLAEIEVYEVLGFVRDIGTKVAAHNTMPRRVILLVKFLFNISCNILKHM